MKPVEEQFSVIPAAAAQAAQSRVLVTDQIPDNRYAISGKTTDRQIVRPTAWHHGRIDWIMPPAYNALNEKLSMVTLWNQ